MSYLDGFLVELEWISVKYIDNIDIYLNIIVGSETMSLIYLR